jgi:YjbE family integral membrane protein
MVLGLATSAILFIIFAALITMLMGLSYVRLGGGLVLLYIAAKLLVPEKADGTEVEAAAHLWRAARLIAIADIIMSLDNIIAVAAVARGNFVLLAIGVAMSVPIMLLGAILIAALLERFAILVWAGAALLGWIAGGIIVADPVVSGYLSGKLGNRHVPQEIEFVAAGAGAVLAVAYGLALRRLGKLRLGAATASRGR